MKHYIPLSAVLGFIVLGFVLGVIASTLAIYVISMLSVGGADLFYPYR